MSIKNNAFMAAAALALGVVIPAGASPICEGILNDVKVTEFGAAEVDSKGRVMVIVSVSIGGVVSVRPVADSAGNVRIFADGNSAVSLAKRSNLDVGVKVKFVKMATVGTVGDPVATLKAKYKKFKAEAAIALKQRDAVAGKVTAGVALGWDLAVGTPEHSEYLDLQARAVSVGEWKTYNDTKVTELAAALVAAGIDPLTVV